MGGECKCCTPAKPRTKRAPAPRVIDSSTLALTKNPVAPQQKNAAMYREGSSSASPPSMDLHQMIPHTRPPLITSFNASSPRPGHTLAHGHAHSHAHHGANSFQPYPHPVMKHAAPSTGVSNERNPYNVFGNVPISPYQSIEATLLPAAGSQDPSGLPAIPDFQTLPQIVADMSVMDVQSYTQSNFYPGAVSPSDTPSPEASSSSNGSTFFDSYTQNESMPYDLNQAAQGSIFPIASYNEFFDIANSMLVPLPSPEQASPEQQQTSPIIPTYAASDCSIDDAERMQDMYSVLSVGRCAGGCGCFEGGCHCGVNCTSSCGQGSNFGSTVSLGNNDHCCVSVWEPYFHADGNPDSAPLTFDPAALSTSEPYASTSPMFKDEASTSMVQDAPSPLEYNPEYVARRPPSLMSTSSSAGSRASTPPLTLSSCASSIRSAVPRRNPIKQGFRRILPKVMKGSDGTMPFKSRLPRVDSVPEPEPDSMMSYIKPSPGIGSYDPWTLQPHSDPASQFRERGFPMPLFPRSHF